ncbi:MAG: hypothetical protein ACI311_01840 [Bacilli bacterium]
MKNFGKTYEELIVYKLNEKRLNELSDFWKTNIKEIFDIKDDNPIITARVVGKKCKTDIEIFCVGKKINVSVKTGEHNSFHQENVFELLDFLSKLGVSKRTINIIKFYHFGDGTIDGTGSKRMDVSEIKVKYGKLIKEANEEINKREIIEKVFERFVIKGANEYYQRIDYIYYGDTEFGYFVTRDELLQYALRHRCMFLTGLHFGPLNYQPYKRLLNSQKKSEKERYIVQIKWIGLLSDIQKIKLAYY